MNDSLLVNDSRLSMNHINFVEFGREHFLRNIVVSWCCRLNVVLFRAGGPGMFMQLMSLPAHRPTGLVAFFLPTVGGMLAGKLFE